MADLVSKARDGRLAALKGRSRSMLFPEVEHRPEAARKPVAAFRARRGVTLFS